MADNRAGESKGTRVIALVGPAGAGKTSLAEAMLFAAGATDRLGSTANGSSIGDSSPEARQRGGRHPPGRTPADDDNALYCHLFLDPLKASAAAL